MANETGNITSAVVGPEYSYYSFSKLLPFARQYMNIALVAQVKPFPKNASTVAHFTRVERLETDPVELTEGITPDATQIVTTTINAAMKEYGRFIQYTDKVEDTSFASVVKEFSPVLGENMGAVLESVNATELCSSLNVIYSNGAARSAVNTAITKSAISKAVRMLERNYASKITAMNNAATLFNTTPIPPCYVAFCHSDLRADLEGIAGFIPVEKYSSQRIIHPNEIGTIGQVRFIMNNFVTVAKDGGGAAGQMLSTTGANADVYVTPIVAKDAFGVINLTGYGAGKMYYVPVGSASKSDPLAQRGSVGYKVWHAAKILNDDFIVKIESAVTA